MRWVTFWFFHVTAQNRMPEVCHEWRLSEQCGADAIVSCTCLCAHTPQTFLIPPIPDHWSTRIQTHSQSAPAAPYINNTCCHCTLQSDTIDPQLTGFVWTGLHDAALLYPLWLFYSCSQLKLNPFCYVFFFFFLRKGVNEHFRSRFTAQVMA